MKKNLELSTFISLLIFILLAIFLKSRIIKETDLVFDYQAVFSYSPVLENFMKAVTSLFSPLIFFFLFLVFLVFLFYKKKFNYIFISIFSIFSGLVLEKIIKFLIKSPRPSNALISVSGFSFPSGHALISTIFFFLIWYSFKKDIKSKFLYKSFLIINIILWSLVCLSRVYLRVHWFSDILGGIFLGGAIIGSSILLENNKKIKSLINKLTKIKQNKKN